MIIVFKESSHVLLREMGTHSFKKQSASPYDLPIFVELRGLWCTEQFLIHVFKSDIRLIRIFKRYTQNSLIEPVTFALVFTMLSSNWINMCFGGNSTTSLSVVINHISVLRLLLSVSRYVNLLSYSCLGDGRVAGPWPEADCPSQCMHSLSTETQPALWQATTGKGLETLRVLFCFFHESSGFRPGVRGKRVRENRNRKKRKCFPFCPPRLGTPLYSSPSTLSLSKAFLFFFFAFWRETAARKCTVDPSGI